jgi:Protein of unknown function (DUF1257)
MSHLTYMKTSLQRLTYLEKALKKLKISYNRKQLEQSQTPELGQIYLTIPQSNSYDLEFAWDGKNYELVVDLSFWAQAYPVDTFLEKVTQEYAVESLVGESQKLGFQVIESEQSVEGVTTLRLERWN